MVNFSPRAGLVVRAEDWAVSSTIALSVLTRGNAQNIPKAAKGAMSRSALTAIHCKMAMNTSTTAEEGLTNPVVIAGVVGGLTGTLANPA